MKSILVFVLWILAILVGFIVVCGPWMLFVSFPRAFWHIYRESGSLYHRDWEMPWFPMTWMTQSIRLLDPKNRIDKPEASGKVWIAGSG
jgi:hypothetical protein